MTDLPFAFHDLPADTFPFTIEMYDVDTRETYETIEVAGPGAVRINPKPTHVRLAGTRMRLPNGTVTEHEP